MLKFNLGKGRQLHKLMCCSMQITVSARAHGMCSRELYDDFEIQLTVASLQKRIYHLILGSNREGWADTWDTNTVRVWSQYLTVQKSLWSLDHSEVLPLTHSMHAYYTSPVVLDTRVQNIMHYLTDLVYGSIVGDLFKAPTHVAILLWRNFVHYL